MSKLSEILRDRGYVYQHSSEKLEEITDGKKRTVYLGVDPTADSIHVGNLAVYMLLRRFVGAGHKVILLIGGGTGMIGDPKPDVERPLTPPEVVLERSQKLATQAKKLLGAEVAVVNNHDWLSTLNLIEFLRDIGKHFTVNNLMKKDAIAKRLESEEGITYTEFAYPLLQAYDFWHLFKTRGCDVQVSGSDQWGNSIAGVELIRRKENKTVYAFTIPLITDKATGKKFGKSEGNAVWLDPVQTSPYAFYQFWLGASDESVSDYLKLFTLISDMEIEAVMEMHRRDAKEHHAQHLLAREVTTLVHGTEIAETVENVSSALFNDAGVGGLDDAAITMLKNSAPSHTVTTGDLVKDALVNATLASSKREARQFFKDKAVSLNGEIITDEKRKLVTEDFYNGVALLKRGKKNVCVLVLS